MGLAYALELGEFFLFAKEREDGGSFFFFFPKKKQKGGKEKLKTRLE